MTNFINLLAWIMVIVGVSIILKLTPEIVADDVIEMIRPKESLRLRKIEAKRGGKYGRAYKFLIQLRTKLEATGKGHIFPIILCGSILLFIVGILVSYMMDNGFIAPAISIFLAIIPYVYIYNTLSKFDKHMKKELETSLSVITSSYIRNNDLLLAIRENLEYIKYPIDNVFKTFLHEATFVYSDTKKALYNLSNRIDDEIFVEWCDTMIQCQEDHTMKDTLNIVIDKYGEMREINEELKTIVASARMEYMTMAGLLIGSVPGIYLINKEWFNTLMNTQAGKIVLGIDAAILLITFVLMLKNTRTIKYKK